MPRLFFYLQRIGAKKRSLLFGKRSLIPAFVFPSLALDHKSAPFKIKHLIQTKVIPLLHISTVQTTNAIQRRTHLAQGVRFGCFHQAFKNIALIQGC